MFRSASILIKSQYLLQLSSGTNCFCGDRNFPRVRDFLAFEICLIAIFDFPSRPFPHPESVLYVCSCVLMLCLGDLPQLGEWLKLELFF